MKKTIILGVLLSSLALFGCAHENKNKDTKKESKIEKDKQTVINGKGSTQSTENHEFHSQKEIQHNSGEKSKSH